MESNLSKCLNKIGIRHGKSRCFTDFLTLAVCALSAKEKEAEYLEVAENYSKSEMLLFSEAFSHLVIEMDNGGEGLKDCLGDLFMNFMSNKNIGQFFTPEDICTLMAKITGGNGLNSESVGDDCCGSGRLLLAAARVKRDQIFSGADIDLNCCKMTLINMCLNGLCGVVRHMDIIKYEVWKCWKVDIHPIFLIPYIREVEIPTKIQKEPEQIIKPIEPQTHKSTVQLDLFA